MSIDVKEECYNILECFILNDMNIDCTCNDKMNSINNNDISDDACFTFELSRDVRRIQTNNIHDLPRMIYHSYLF